MAEVTLSQILDARENRAKKQKQLLRKFQKPLICFTMNIAGPVKLTPEITRGFCFGSGLLLARLAKSSFVPLHIEEQLLPTGCEGYYIVDAPAETIKALTVELEEESPLGRLFDLDVLTASGEKLERPIPRTCLICGKTAAVCSRSRAHSVEHLQAATDKLLSQISKSQLIGCLAQKALILEVCCTPKPGLVDRKNQGSHRDMDIFTFFRSITALGDYFEECAKTGEDTAHLPAKDTFQKLREAGIRAEKAMFAATVGVNTHKGAIFTLGLLCGSAGRLHSFDPELLCQEAAAMVQGIVARELAGVSAESALTAGQQLYRRYGITGVRGEAEQGFPAVLNIGLPVLKQGLAQGLDLNDSGCATLLAILAHSEDTNLITRGGREAQLHLKNKLQSLLQENPYPSRQTLQQLDEEFIQKNLSPGGSADLLAACYFLQQLQSLPLEGGATRSESKLTYLPVADIP